MSAVLEDLFDRRVLFVTGKGGTGKSTMAAALALLAHDIGMRVLLVDIEARGDAAAFLDAGPPTYRAREAFPGLAHLAFQPEEALDEYLKLGLKLPRAYRIGPLHRVFDFIATAAPGVSEVLVAGKVGFEERAREGDRPRWDLIVVDAAPSGQVLSHLRAPRTIIELVKVGLIRNQTQWIREIIEDPRRTAMVVVSLAEEMPVAETEELLERTPKEVNTPIAALIVNRVIPPPPDDAPAALKRRKSALKRSLGVSIGPAVDAVELFADLAASQDPYLARLHSLGPPVLEVPFLPLTDHTLDVTRRVAEILDEQ